MKVENTSIQQKENKIIYTTLQFEILGMFHIRTKGSIGANVLQISEGTNSVGIVRWDLGFCLCAVSGCGGLIK
jgi:hypothetical protein